MKVVILAGGLGTRISEETYLKPKPMIEIGGKPIIWHIMKLYSSHGINDFIICLGYKGYTIKEYFANYYMHQSDVTFDLANNSTTIHNTHSEQWRVTLIDTGEHTQTGGRLQRVREYLHNETFCFTYGDGVSNVDITKLFHFHKSHKKFATLTAIQPPGRFGAVEIRGGDNAVLSFREKPAGDGSWVSGGFFILEPEVFEYLEGDDTIWERQPLETLAANNQLSAYFHEGFWYAMDTQRDKFRLEELWASGSAPWKVW